MEAAVARVGRVVRLVRMPGRVDAVAVDPPVRDRLSARDNLKPDNKKAVFTPLFCWLFRWQVPIPSPERLLQTEAVRRSFVR